MSDFKTVKGRIVSNVGELRVCGEADRWLQKVELWLLNGETNRNNWRYENLEQHRHLFADTPILVAYVGKKIGDGHNFADIPSPDGSGEVVKSFMAATAERIVGYFRSESDIRIEKADGKTWIVGTGYLWKWYAQELVAKLKLQGLQGMSVSIETLIDDLHKDGSTEVFTRYQVLGTTILGDNVSPAVADANIRILSALGTDNLKKMTLRVASEQEKPDQKKHKGVRIMNAKDLKGKFEGLDVLAVNGENVALLDESGNTYLSTAVKANGEIVTGVKNEIHAVTLSCDGASVEVPVEALFAKVNATVTALQSEVAEANKAKDAALAALSSMQKAEHDRRLKSVRDAIVSHLADIREHSDADIAEDACDDLLTDEALENYAGMENANGEFCGEAEAIKDVDSRCMGKILSVQKQKMNASQHKFAWDFGKEKPEPETGVYAAVARTLK